MSTLRRNRVVEITHSFDKIGIVGHQALSLKKVFQEIGLTQLVQSVGQEGNNNKAQSTVLAAPVGHPTQQGMSSGTGGSQSQNRFHALQARQDQKDSPDVVTVHVGEERKELAKDVHRLARLGVGLTDMPDGGVIT
uniref:Integrase core domain containing protein n=1 Tax=Solanum tuberosum TaxID=4113 RepID=M1DJ22_SOLTU